MEEESPQKFLTRFCEEFPSVLDPDSVLPVTLPNQKICPEDLQGLSLDLGLGLLSERHAPEPLSSLLLHAAVSQLLQTDLTPFHCSKNSEDEPVLLDPEPVFRCFLNALVGVALQWQQAPPTLPSVPRRVVSSHAIRNARRKMEDKHVILPHFSLILGLNDGVPRSYLAVFDGHGGSDVACFASQQLHVILSQQNDLTSDPESALKRAFTETDLRLQERCLRSGSTAVAALIQGQRLLLAWLGDSQALLVRHGKEEEVMEPHKPDREDERQRIEDLGGCVAFLGCWRVNGTYAVSRALGDFDQKPFVSSEADCRSLELQGDEDFLLLACDGFFDAVPPSDVPGLVLAALRGRGRGEEEGRGQDAERGRSLAAQEVAQALVAHAKDAGSRDNITVLVLFLRTPESLLQDHAPSE